MWKVTGKKGSPAGPLSSLFVGEGIITTSDVCSGDPALRNFARLPIASSRNLGTKGQERFKADGSKIFAIGLG